MIWTRFELGRAVREVLASRPMTNLLGVVSRHSEELETMAVEAESEGAGIRRG